MTHQRCSVSFTPETWARLQSEKNVSKAVNAAVNFYLDAKNFLKEQEHAFILKELAQYIPREKRRTVPNRAVYEPERF